MECTVPAALLSVPENCLSLSTFLVRMSLRRSAILSIFTLSILTSNEILIRAVANASAIPVRRYSFYFPATPVKSLS